MHHRRTIGKTNVEIRTWCIENAERQPKGDLIAIILRMDIILPLTIDDGCGQSAADDAWDRSGWLTGYGRINRVFYAAGERARVDRSESLTGGRRITRGRSCIILPNQLRGSTIGSRPKVAGPFDHALGLLNLDTKPDLQFRQDA